jgi:hypothetical protein
MPHKAFLCILFCNTCTRFFYLFYFVMHAQGVSIYSVLQYMHKVFLSILFCNVGTLKTFLSILFCYARTRLTGIYLFCNDFTEPVKITIDGTDSCQKSLLRISLHALKKIFPNMSTFRNAKLSPYITLEVKINI